MIRGPLGVGKSTVSARLAKLIGGRHIQIDQVLEEHHLEEWDTDRISLLSFLRANGFAAAQARRAFRRGNPAILDGCFYWAEQLSDLERRLDRPHLVLSLEAPLSICVSRDRSRPLPQPGVEPRGGDQLGADAAEAVHRLVRETTLGEPIDASGTVDATVAQIVERLSGFTRPASPRRAELRAKDHGERGGTPR